METKQTAPHGSHGPTSGWWTGCLTQLFPQLGEMDIITVFLQTGKPELGLCMQITQGGTPPQTCVIPESTPFQYRFAPGTKHVNLLLKPGLASSRDRACIKTRAT